MSSCPFNDWLGAYRDGELKESLRVQTESHLKECPSCAAEMARLESLSGLLLASAPKPMLPIAIHRLHKKVERAMEEKMLRIVRVLNAVAACVLIAGSAWLMNRPRQSPTVEPGAVEPGAVERGAVERGVGPAVPPWVDLVSDSSTGANSTPATAWYLADDTGRSDDAP
jgi:anti-sigma factor RsiW